MSSVTGESFSGPTTNDETNDDYDELPEVVRQYYSRKEYLWLTDQQKADLIQLETEPEWN